MPVGAILVHHLVAMLERLLLTLIKLLICRFSRRCYLIRFDCEAGEFHSCVEVFLLWFHLRVLLILLHAPIALPLFCPFL
jgi:hypothetical protein